MKRQLRARLFTSAFGRSEREMSRIAIISQTAKRDRYSFRERLLRVGDAQDGFQESLNG